MLQHHSLRCWGKPCIARGDSGEVFKWRFKEKLVVLFLKHIITQLCTQGMLTSELFEFFTFL